MVSLTSLFLFLVASLTCVSVNAQSKKQNANFVNLRGVSQTAPAPSPRMLQAQNDNVPTISSFILEYGDVYGTPQENEPDTTNDADTTLTSPLDDVSQQDEDINDTNDAKDETKWGILVAVMGAFLLLLLAILLPACCKAPRGEQTTTEAAGEKTTSREPVAAATHHAVDRTETDRTGTEGDCFEHPDIWEIRVDSENS
jgi:hypothetical protein